MSCFVFRQFLMDSFAGITMTLIIMSSSHQGEFHSTLFFPALHYLLLQTLHSTDSTPSWHRIIAILLTNDKVSKYCSHTPPSMFRIQLGPKFFVRKWLLINGCPTYHGDTYHDRSTESLTLSLQSKMIQAYQVSCIDLSCVLCCVYIVFIKNKSLVVSNLDNRQI